jgi:dihydrofolate synthase/folylpolyglutamate synthase
MSTVLHDQYQVCLREIESYIPSKGRIFTLDRITQLLSRLGNPHVAYPVIHVGGTAGKSSTSAMIAQMLTESGYRTGLHTSPHLVSATERLIIDGVCIPEEKFILLWHAVKPHVVAISEILDMGKPTYFEILVCMMFLYFKNEHIDVAVVEVGLGGKVDGTNVVDSAVAVLTNVGLDHTEILGNTVEEIVMDKREIIKPGKISVSGVTQETVRAAVIDKAHTVASMLYLLGRDFHTEHIRSSTGASYVGCVFDYVSSDRTIRNIELGMIGEYQVTNAAVAITAVIHLEHFVVSDDAIRRALMDLSYPGRFEYVNHDTHTYIIDGAHNPMKIGAFVSSVKTVYPAMRFPIVMAVKDDKDIQHIMEYLIPIASEFHFVSFSPTLDIKHASMSHTDYLAQAVNTIDESMRVYQYQSVEACLQSIEQTQSASPIIITGSLYFVGKIHDLWEIPFQMTKHAAS